MKGRPFERSKRERNSRIEPDMNRALQVTMDNKGPYMLFWSKEYKWRLLYRSCKTFCVSSLDLSQGPKHGQDLPQVTNFLDSYLNPKSCILKLLDEGQRPKDRGYRDGFSNALFEVRLSVGGSPARTCVMQLSR